MKKLIFVFFLAIGLTLNAQPDWASGNGNGNNGNGKGGNGNGNCPPNNNNPHCNSVPIDGGLSLLLAAGAGLGYTMYYKRKEDD